VAVVVALCLWVQEPGLAELLERFRSEAIAEREDAAKRLKEIGLPALAVLDRAAKDADSEVAERAALWPASSESRRSSAPAFSSGSSYNGDAMRKVSIIGVPLDLGADRRGVDMGPSALRVTGLAQRIRELGDDVRDTGDIDVPLPEECEVGDPHRKYAAAITQVCLELAERVYAAAKEGRTPVTLGGDHSLAMGSVAGIARRRKEQGEKIGLLWFDAHGDMNTPDSSPTGNVHGMPVAHILGMGDPGLAGIGGVKPKVLATNTCLVGIRDLDAREKQLIADSGVSVYTMKDIDRHGVSHVMEEAIDRALRGTSGMHVSFDIDSIDPGVARGTGTPKKGGLTYREAHLCMEMVADSKVLTSLDMVEINPILDNQNSTAELGAELILSALGKSIF